MAKSSLTRTPHRGSPGRGRAPASSVSSRQVHPGAPLTQDSILALQQTAGNKAVVQRLLWTPAEFQKNTYAGFASMRGKTLKEIERLLRRYHEIKKSGQHLDPRRPEMNEFENLLTDLVEDSQLWLDDHEGDKSRSRHRTRGMQDLNFLAGRELTEFKKLRATATKGPTGTSGPLGAAPAFTRADNKFKAKMQGNASKLLSFIGGVVSSAIPAPGDSSDLEIEAQIPVDPSASAYVGVKITGSASRMDKEATKIGFNFAVTGGAKIAGVADLGLELGSTIEAQASTPAKAMELISWGWYQRFRESKLLPREVANLMWGGSGSVVGWRRAERWAARVEQENFMIPQGQNRALSSGVGSAATTNAYVRTGGYFGASAEGGVGGVAKVGGEAQLGWGRHFDQDTIEARKQARGGAVGKALAVPTLRGTAKSLGTRYVTLGIKGSVSAGPVSADISANLEFLREGLKGRPMPQFLDIWLNGGFTAPLNSQLGDKIALVVSKAAPEVAVLIHKIASKLASKEKAAPGDTIGSIIDAGEGVTSIASTFPTDIPGSTFDFGNIDWSLPPDSPMQDVGTQAQAGFSTEGPMATLGLSLGIGVQFRTDGQRIKPVVTFDVQLTYVKALEMSVSLLKFGLTKGRRIVRLRYDGGWKFD